ncbi:MAG: NUDIX domain-containing protein [Minisyncoccia bacterium]
MKSFSACFILGSYKSDLMVLCVTDTRFPLNVKMPGGMAICKETPEETMRREVFEETGGTRIVDSYLVHVVIFKNLTQYFYLATRVIPGFGPDRISKFEENIFCNDVTISYIIARWLPIREFADKLYHGQHGAFGAILVELAKDQRFLSVYSELLQRFPNPNIKS